MVNVPHKFKHRDVVRVLRAGAAGGMSNPTLEVHLPSGTKYVLGGEVLSPSKKSAQRGAGAAGGKKKPAPSGGMARPARGGQTGT
jgi:hypothetical protein